LNTTVLPTTRAAATAAPAAVKTRIVALDALRGLALIMMGLDHAAAAVNVSLQAETYGGQAATLLSWPYWVSGMLTNIAAPAFWLLSGVSVSLLEASRRRAGASEADITRFLLIRALVILTLDLTICWAAWGGRTPYLHVLLNIGLSLMALSVLRRLPLWAFGALMAAQVLGYQLALPYIAANFSQTESLWAAIFLGYSTVTRPAVEFSVLGWSGLMGLGYLLGRLINHPALQRPGTWLAVGAALLSGALLLRGLGGFGDLAPYTAGQPWYYFLVMSKTPPGLAYLMFNLGWAALLLAAFYLWPQRLERAPGQWLVIGGQVSLFFYVMHIIVYNLFGHAVLALALPGPPIIQAYLAWASGLLVLLPLSAAYRRLRRGNPQSFLRYL
jgi:uncharacterized membrane protein